MTVATMNAAKYAQRLKAIRKVKAAIRYQLQARKRLEPIRKERKETKAYIVGNLQRIKDVIKGDAKAARKRAREDFELGPLRPNRAVGEAAATYGTMGRADMSMPPIPKHWFGAGEKLQKRMKTRIPEHVLSDQWPIVEGDRVVVIRGRELDKIGTVKTVDKENSSLVITDINKAWVDGRIYTLAPGEKAPVKRENEISMPYDDVRLVAPYTVTDIDSNGQKFERVTDVIVDKVDMEEHTSGKNLFTGEEDDWNISEDQRVDPETDQKIYHRYIAGTRTVIEWPWQQDKPAEDGQEKPKTNEDDSQGIMQKSLKSLQSLLPSGKAKEAKRIAAQEDQQKKREQMAEQQREARKNILAKPREKDPREYEDDTPRNVVEINEMDMDNAGLFRPTLLYPTMPVSIITELRDLRAKEVDEKAIDKDERIEQLRAQRRERVQKEKEQIAARIASMKTPMQIRRDLEQAKKQKHDLAAPTAPSEALLRVLGKQMDKNERLRKEIKVSRAEGLARMEQERTRMQEEKAAKKAHVQEAIAEKRARIQKAAEERSRMREVKGRQVWKGRHEAKAVHELNV